MSPSTVRPHAPGGLILHPPRGGLGRKRIQLVEGVREFGRPKPTPKSPRTASGGTRLRSGRAFGARFFGRNSRAPSVCYKNAADSSQRLADNGPMPAAARQADPDATEMVFRVEDLARDNHLESQTVRALRGVS